MGADPEQHQTHVAEGDGITKGEDSIDQFSDVGSPADNSSTEDEVPTTFKTWLVVIALTSSFGFSFWIVPVFANIQTAMATQLGDPTAATWWIPGYTLSTAISSMLFASNSDLFGRRWFIICGNVLCFVSLIMIGSAKNTDVIIAASVVSGVASGLTTLATFALPELLPNRLRPVGIAISGTAIFAGPILHAVATDMGNRHGHCTCIILGPIAGKVTIRHGDQWRWLFYGPSIGSAMLVVVVFMLYYPPKHPRGIPWNEAVRQLDYIGALFFTAGAVSILTGVVYTTTIPASSPKVIGLLVAGFVVLTAFALYEHFMTLPAALAPPHVFSKDKGRAFTLPFIAVSINNMFYYSTSIAYPTMIAVFWTDASTPLSYQLALTLPPTLGVTAGQISVAAFGSYIKHYKLQYLIAVTLMVLFGALLGIGNVDNRGTIMGLAFLCQYAYGWSIPLSFTWVQFGVPQVELGVSGGLASVGRWSGGALSSSIYTTILTNTLTSEVAKLVPKAALAAGLSSSAVPALIAALPQGARALQDVPGITSTVITSAGKAYLESYHLALRTMCLASLGFGVVSIIAVAMCGDVTSKLTHKTEVFLENDKNAEKNRYH